MSDNNSRQIQENKIRLEYMKNKVAEIESDGKESAKKFITRKEFEPVRKIVYGLVGLVLTGVVGALISLVVQ